MSKINKPTHHPFFSNQLSFLILYGCEYCQKARVSSSLWLATKRYAFQVPTWLFLESVGKPWVRQFKSLVRFSFFFLNNIKIFLKRPLRWCPPVQLVIVYLDLLIPFSLSTRDLPYPLYFSVHDCRSSSISFLTHLPPRKMTLSHPLYTTDYFFLAIFSGPWIQSQAHC